MFYIVISKVAILAKIVKVVIEAKKIKMLKMNVMTTISVMMKLMIFVIAVTSIINYQYTSIVSTRILFTLTINARKKIIDSKTVVKKTMICIRKRKQKNKLNKTFKTFIRHIFLIKVFVNELKIDYCNFYILDSKATHHCFDNKVLFKNLRAIYEMIKTASDETLNIEIISDIKIFLSNGEFLILIEIMYISILMINLIVISRLSYKDFDVLYLTDQSCKICLFNDQLMTNANMINNQ